MFVRSKPLSKLCEFNGKGLPEDYKSDCYADVDETEYACKEKKRIMVCFINMANLFLMRPPSELVNVEFSICFIQRV